MQPDQGRQSSEPGKPRDGDRRAVTMPLGKQIVDRSEITGIEDRPPRARAGDDNRTATENP